MAIIVQKFGGTSVADEEKREHVYRKIKQELDRGNKSVVVVSAPGRRGAPYATDTLLELIPGAGPETVSLIGSCGEIISACIVTHGLNERGIPARAMNSYTAGIRAVGPYEAAQPETVETANLEKLIKAGIVPVVPGFNGVLSDLSLATFGRGGSDTIAVAIGAWLHADYVDIFTDVPGVAMTDPRIFPQAPFIPCLDYKSMFKLSSQGSKVLQDLSAKVAMEKNVRVRVRSTFDEKPGTTIAPHCEAEQRDLVGVVVKDKDTEVSAVILVYRDGQAKNIAEQIGISPNSSGDPDIVSFDIPNGRVKEILQIILAPYL